MSLLTIVLIAIALSMDALAVAIACGINVSTVRMKHATIVGAWFGSFQAIMPTLGWLAGTRIAGLIAGIDHWVAFVLLSLVGGHMIYESIDQGNENAKIDPMNTRLMFILAIATSVDAMGAGLSFAMLHISIAGPAILIGLITFAISFAGVWIGKKAGELFESRVRLVGGLILIAIGIRILASHLTAG